MGQIAVTEKCVESVERCQRDQRPARQPQDAARRVTRLEPAEDDNEQGRAQETEEDAAHARFERQLLTAEEDAVRRPLRRNTVEQNTQRLRLQASSKPEGKDLFGFASVERGAFTLAGVDAQLAQGATFVRVELVFGQRIFGLREQSGAERWIGDGALEHRLYCFRRHGSDEPPATASIDCPWGPGNRTFRLPPGRGPSPGSCRQRRTESG